MSQDTNQQSQVVVVDLSKVDPTVATVIKAAQQKSEGAVTAQKVEDWTNVGIKLGEAIQALCKTLNTEVNEFAKTPVGLFSMGIIVWKVMGNDLWSIIGGTSMFFILNTIVLWSFRYFHMSERIVTKKGEEKEIVYKRRFTFNAPAGYNDISNEVVSAIAHVIAFLAISGVSATIVF